MKKLIFLFAIMFAGVMVFGQNEAYVKQLAPNTSEIQTSQNGDGNLIYGPASIPGGLPAGATVSTAAYQKATAAPSIFRFGQKGDDNIGEVWQVASKPSGYMAKMFWQQTGDRNWMRVKQISLYGPVTSNGKQVGDDNKFGGLNNAGPYWGTPSGMTVNPNSYAQQQSHGIMDISFVQIGDLNEVGLYQNNPGFGNYFDLYQNGNSNMFAGYQTKTLGASPSTWNSMKVTQLGDSYKCWNYQNNPSGGHNLFASYQN